MTELPFWDLRQLQEFLMTIMQLNYSDNYDKCGGDKMQKQLLGLIFLQTDVVLSVKREFINTIPFSLEDKLTIFPICADSFPNKC